VNVLPSPENVDQSYELNLIKAQEEKKKIESGAFFPKIIYKLRTRLNNMFFPNIFDVIVNSIQVMEYVISESDSKKADIALRPIVIGVDWFEFFKVGELVKKGEEEAINALVEIKRLVSE